MTNPALDPDLAAGLSDPGVGGHPAKLLDAAAGALYQLTSRLPQLCRQLATILTTAASNGRLTGPDGAPELAAAEILTTVYERLNAAHQTLGPVGGFLSADAEARAGDGED
jgi:hypothetical protein